MDVLNDPIFSSPTVDKYEKEWPCKHTFPNPLFENFKNDLKVIGTLKCIKMYSKWTQYIISAPQTVWERTKSTF